MKFQKGNKLGGRKPLTEEIKNVIELHKEEITQEALIKLANSKVFKALNNCEKIEDIKGLGLPITLKGMTDKSVVKVELPKPILDLTKIDVLSDNSNNEDTEAKQEN